MRHQTPSWSFATSSKMRGEWERVQVWPAGRLAAPDAVSAWIWFAFQIWKSSPLGNNTVIGKSRQTSIRSEHARMLMRQNALMSRVSLEEEFGSQNACSQWRDTICSHKNNSVFMIHSECLSIHGCKRPWSRPPESTYFHQSWRNKWEQFLEEAMKGLTDYCLDAIPAHQKRLIALGSICHPCMCPLSESKKSPNFSLFTIVWCICCWLRGILGGFWMVQVKQKLLKWIRMNRYTLWEKWKSVNWCLWNI